MEENNNYKAVVVKITNLRKHGNADRLLCTSVFGNNIIVGLDTKEGDLGLYFPLEAQIGLEFAVANDLIRRKDENNKAAGGMFDVNRRVRCQTFRGEKSEGFWIPIDSLQKLDDYLEERSIVNSLGHIDQEGLELGIVDSDKYIHDGNQICICQKYVPTMNQARNSGTGPKGKQPREERIIPGQFNFHSDTAQLGKNMHKVNPNDLVAVSWKMHGTSAIVSNCLCKRKKTRGEKFLFFVGKLLGVKMLDPVHYDYIYASRKVIKNNDLNKEHNHYYGYDIWKEAGQVFVGNLHNGETIYYEIVGYKKDGGYIQGPYDYGCEVGKHKIYVYRITQTNTEGKVFELQWNQVKERCNQLGVEYCPEIYYGKASELPIFMTGITLPTESHWHETVLDQLKTKYVHDQDSIFCKNKVAEEGIVVRKEGLEIEAFKLKAYRFLEHETKQLDSGEVDIETQQSMTEDDSTNMVAVPTTDSDTNS